MPACPNDEAILNEFTRVRVEGNKVLLECCLVSWPTPSDPTMRWVLARTLPGPLVSWEEDIPWMRRALLLRLRFFRVCKRCHERQPRGWMMDTDTCQGCAERDLDVVH
jgi:hypothetical protein